MLISLPYLQLLEIAGTDAVSFAHAQFSTDVRQLENGRSQWSTWLSPQGRVRAFFMLLREDDEHLRMLLHGGSAETLRVELSRYVLRAKVTLRVIDATVFGADQKTAGALPLPGSPERWLVTGAVPTSAADESAAAEERWRLADIRSGLPVLADNLRDALLPQWLGFDRFGAVSVKKGCYPGQEVMSRLHFKGGNKRSLYRIALAGTVLPEPGMALMMQEENAGQIVMAAHREDGGVEALASLADAVARTPGSPISSGLAVLQRFG